MRVFVFIIAMSSERLRTREVAKVNILTTRRLGSHQSAGLITVASLPLRERMVGGTPGQDGSSVRTLGGSGRVGPAPAGLCGPTGQPRRGRREFYDKCLNLS